MKRLIPIFVLTLLTLPVSVHAILLDCEINAQRVYTCVELDTPEATAETTDTEEPDGDEYGRYIEQARKQCVYNEPRRRTAGKNTGIALRTEELKTARKKYEQCISETARQLWRKDNPSDQGR
jgi:hypothetical protein